MAQNWMPRERWDALVRGEGCPICVEAVSDAQVGEDGYVVADLAMSRLRLSVHQSLPGYCVLLCKKHVREPYELSPEDQMLFFADMMRVGKALEQTFDAVKMNFELLGNAVPHLHCHIKPRYYGDPAPGIPIWPDQRPLFLTPDEYVERAALIRTALASQGAPAPHTGEPLP
jgi:diadenosine tetraphosphate (Ap4A) HIT family hydrolase